MKLIHWVNEQETFRDKFLAIAALVVAAGIIVRAGYETGRVLARVFG
jgi:hypothetical protein